MNQLSTKLAITIIVIIAFIDGILVAGSLKEKLPQTVAVEGIIIEDIFEPVQVELKAQNIVPFTIQAPLGWYKPYTEFSEEAAAYMAVKWANGEIIESPQSAAKDMLEIGEAASSINEVLSLITDRHKHLKAFLTRDNSQASIEQELKEGHLIILSVNGEKLENPYYGDPAPKNHTLLLIGQNDENFIVHDPGTVRGRSYEYKKNTLMSAIQGESMVVVTN